MVSRLEAADYDRLFGYPEGWSEAEGVNAQKGAEGGRLRALGNSIPPGLCNYIARSIMHPLAGARHNNSLKDV